MLTHPIATPTPPRPFLKWAGGKTQLIPQYTRYFPRQFDTYYEPFLGGGAIFFHLSSRIKRAVLSDINAELVNVYRWVRDDVQGLIERLADHRRRHCQEHYYSVRAIAYTSPIDRAARLIYLNKTCFNGLYRENSQGKFNVPMGRYKNPTVFDPEVMYAASEALQSAEIMIRPFESVLEQATAGDFVYFDPPYHPISATSNFTGYSRHTFGAEEHINLRDTFAQLADQKTHVMLSNSDCAFVHDLYRRFEIHTIQASRSINCNAKRRGKITEVLVTSY